MPRGERTWPEYQEETAECRPDYRHSPYITDPRLCLANKRAISDEPRRNLAFTHEGPEQEILPGLPRGFLAYRMNFKSDTVNGGGRGGPETTQGPSGHLFPTPTPTDQE